MISLRSALSFISCLSLAACAAAPADGTSKASAAAETSATSTHDWPRFGGDVGRSSSSPDPTGITAANVAGLTRQQVTLDGTVDASVIYLHGVRAGGGTHDVFFVTTTYGKTIAIDAANGAILWEFTPTGYDSWAGSRQITTATPVADPSRDFIYAASPDGHIQKLSVADGHSVWSTPITNLPSREKIASSLNYFRGRVVAVTGGYIGDAPPYQGHVAVLDASSGRLLHVWNSLCSDRAGVIDPSSCSESGSAIWGRAGAVIDSTTGDIYVATGNATWDGKTNWGDAAISLDADATRIVDNYTPTNTNELSARDADVGFRRQRCGDDGVDVQRRPTRGEMEERDRRHESTRRGRTTICVRSRRRARSLRAGNGATGREARLRERTLEQPDRRRRAHRAAGGKRESTSHFRRS